MYTNNQAITDVSVQYRREWHNGIFVILLLLSIGDACRQENDKQGKNEYEPHMCHPVYQLIHIKHIPLSCDS